VYRDVFLEIRIGNENRSENGRRDLGMYNNV
jgi:hypothetical protein